MNRRLLPAITVLTLAGLVLLSCASIPKPEAESDTLVLGTFEVDYPDGFFDQAPRTLVSNIRLDFVNMTTGKEFWATTDFCGHFSFLSAGGQSYALKRSAYDLREGNETFSGSSSVSYQFSAPTHSVLYVGHLSLREEKPTRKETVSGETTWSFTDYFDRSDRSDEMKAYLQKSAKDTPWLSYDFVSVFARTHVSTS